MPYRLIVAELISVEEVFNTESDLRVLKKSGIAMDFSIKASAYIEIEWEDFPRKQVW